VIFSLIPGTPNAQPEPKIRTPYDDHVMEQSQKTAKQVDEDREKGIDPTHGADFFVMTPTKLTTPCFKRNKFVNAEYVMSKGPLKNGSEHGSEIWINFFRSSSAPLSIKCPPDKPD
jgi:hypothetical protein